MIQFNHFNFNVLDLDKSLAFYKEALGLEPVRVKDAADGSFQLVYLGDGRTGFQLELTWLRDRTEPYNLGECEFHLAFVTDQYQEFYEKHKAMGCICFENPAMGIYFISDPDGYWIEIVPEKDRCCPSMRGSPAGRSPPCSWCGECTPWRGEASLHWGEPC